MSAIRVIITGGSGLLGQYLNIELSDYYDILTLHSSNAGNTGRFKNKRINLLNFKDVEMLFEEFIPHIVIHAAAVNISNTESDTNHKRVYDTNVTLTEIIAKQCEKRNCKMIYLSTDLVYAGYRGALLKEDAKLVPVSLYAETKLMGELKIKSVFNNYIILRSSLLYGFGLNHSYPHFHQMYDKLKKGEKVKLFADQFRSPLSLIEAAMMIRKICSSDLKEKTFNFGGIERVSRYELGKRVCKICNFDASLIQPILMSDFPDYPAVADVSMDVSLLSSFGIQSNSIDESLEEILNNQEVTKR